MTLVNAFQYIISVDFHLESKIIVLVLPFLDAKQLILFVSEIRFVI